MATTILVKRNTTNSSAPSTSDLEIGEFAFDLFCNYQKFVQEITDIWSGELTDDNVITGICTKYILKTNQFNFLRS